MGKSVPGKDRIINILVAVVGLVAAMLRTFYIYYTPVWRRQHDVLNFGADEGQAAFIEFFHQGHLLLDFDPREKWGFFQAPLHHMLAALWIRLQELIGFDYHDACEHVQVLTLIYSLVAMYFGYRLLKYFRLSGEALLLSFALFALHPGFILMSGSINNDMLSIMLTVMAIYYGLRWNDEPDWKYTVILAFVIGLGMMTKLSTGLIAPAVALLFIVKWIQGGISKIPGFLLKYLVFIVICAPLALWSPVRNLLKFGVPLGYTPEVGEPVLSSAAARIFDLRCKTPYLSRITNGDPFDEFNIFLGMMKTSLFGDENFTLAVSEAGHSGVGAFLMTVFGWSVLISGSLVALICFYSTIRVLITKRYIASAVIRAYLGTIYLTALLMYVSFMFKAPFSSSMDFRYVLYLIPVEALMLGLCVRDGRKGIRTVAFITVAVFSLSTVLLYVMLSRG